MVVLDLSRTQTVLKVWVNAHGRRPGTDFQG